MTIQEKIAQIKASIKSIEIDLELMNHHTYGSYHKSKEEELDKLYKELQELESKQ